VSPHSNARLAPLEPGRTSILAWVRQHLGHLVSGEVSGSRIGGGQTAANLALTSFDVTGYARRRNEVWPVSRRGASGLSPYIRHGLLTLPQVWHAVAGGPAEDVSKFRDELRWQEYARHLYARLGRSTAKPLRFSVVPETDTSEQPWGSDAACIDGAWRELTQDGWLTNQQRMWLASHWHVRRRAPWRTGEDEFFRHLLDGSRAANRVGWQWVTGGLTGKPYGFARWQVEKRAPDLCATCPLTHDCPIEDWPTPVEPIPLPTTDPRMRRDLDPIATAGPKVAVVCEQPEAVWLTAESLGDGDPALSAYPDIPAVFVFDEPLLAALHLSASRLVFLAESLADLSQRRSVEVYLGDPAHILRGRRLAVTFAPVPGFRRFQAELDLVSLHPWPWLEQPHGGPVTSFTAWSRARR
jgi:deoxyribodipyrimidine photo-lyase